MRDGIVDILFANESELHALYRPRISPRRRGFAPGKSAGRDHPFRKRRDRRQGQKTWEVPAAPIDKLVDTTGAATCSPPVFSPAIRRAGRSIAARASAPWPQAKSSSISALDRRSASPTRGAERLPPDAFRKQGLDPGDMTDRSRQSVANRRGISGGSGGGQS